MAAAISAFYFFYFALIGVYIIYMPKILETIGYSGGEIGAIFAAAPLMRFLVPFFFLKMLQLTHKLFYASLGLSVLSALLFYITLESFWPLLAVNALLGVGLSLTLPYVEVIALQVISKERYGKIRLFGSIGFIVVALTLANFISAQTSLHFLSTITVLTAISGLFVLHYERHIPAFVESSRESSKFSLMRYWPLWASLFLMQTSFGPFYNFFTNYETAHGISITMVSYLWSFGVLAEIILFYFQAPLMKYSMLTLIELATIFTAFRWFLYYLFPQSLPMLFFAQSLHALSFALYHTAAISYLYELYHNKKLAQQFLFGFSYGLGGFAGALIAGEVYENFSEYLYLYASAVTLLSLQFLLIHKKRLKLSN